MNTGAEDRVFEIPASAKAKARDAGGRIQLQSEGFGIEYRNIVLSPLLPPLAKSPGN